ncbi:deoxyribodipyrimidine photolyase [Rhizobium leguminosarum]|uniref:Deoxyribodipyrimidine photolyase n=1 Tax=Rhizobium leguminosarum TaxID=384 RepID=A0AAE2MKS4_RHILE|nr:deoxyribodipyrimidine photolyase [Rhizobium leguminosarum]MBB4431867.1 deoxyribodipyrimidine photolyase [Rhizobium esperanzae]MBB4297408.1 deoxyribodipyrimidine photolyase [Rhizobium leguminosarum]MBB5652090.1 deoxyribodipyrimidine photolyase [Rhizobium leguminosarum]MBB6264663.1 deoxyribodipyrimidine photolyase [Rhizobium leguminosarum]
MAKDTAKPVILWFRKDLRLDDNQALNAAHLSGRPVILLYISEPAAHTGPLGAAQAWWLHHSLAALDRALRRRQGRLVLACGEALEVLRAIIRESGAEAVFWNRRYDPSGTAVDIRIEHELDKQAIEARSFGGQLLHEPSRLMTDSGTPYRVYTPFWHALEGAANRSRRWRRRRNCGWHRRFRNRKGWRAGNCCRRSRTGRGILVISGRRANKARGKSSVPSSRTCSTAIRKTATIRRSRRHRCCRHI